VKHTDISSIELYKEGQRLEQLEHSEAERGKQGALRGGNSGCLTETGQPIGGSTSCPRKAQARFIGLQVPASSKAFPFFDAGYANEWLWEQKLAKSWKGKVLTEADPAGGTKWTIEGVDVTGRPDIQLINEDGTVEVVLELKCKAATNSAFNVGHHDRPDPSHLMQLAHYMFCTNAPGILVYSFRGKGSTSYWAYKETGIRDIEPFDREYKLGWEGPNDDHLYYIRDNGEKQETLITKTGIKEYYRSIVVATRNGELASKPANITETGSKMKYSSCQYCDLKPICKVAKDLDRFKDELEVMIGDKK